MSQIKDSENFFIVNLLTKNADILSKGEVEEMKDLTLALSKGEGIGTDVYSLSFGEGRGEVFETELLTEAIEKGYICDEIEEKKLFRNAYLDFIDSRDTDEIQIFFVTNYACNFACSYCYQDEYSYPNQQLTKDIIDSFFDYIKKEFPNRKKYLTIFGGEPLLDNPSQREMIQHIITRSNDNNLDISFVTNGYTIVEYFDLLKTARIREIQITLDGTENVHNSRRFLKNGQATFNKIVAGIDLCLQNDIPVNLRFVADKENIDNLPELARFAIEKAWTKSPNFKTQIGRNYELHHCQQMTNNLFSRVSLYEKIYEIYLQNSSIIEFHKPAFFISKFLFENNSLPNPLFDSCPACKTEWAFDYTGKIYSCTATVGKSDESLGTFYPEISRKDEIISQWQSRDITEIKECKSCSVALACGGGCASVAKNINGQLNSPDCRPVKELLEMGMSFYFEKVENV
ncbi:MAG: radical SAM protein [Candidatus Kapabacteria bacterium]|nr:radical SAM protein [Candidatus Kapabacteria bacterium]